MADTRQIIQRPEVVVVNSNKTDRQYFVRYAQLVKHLEEMITLEHLGQQFTRRALRKWCKKNSRAVPKGLLRVQLYLHDHVYSWSYLREQLQSNLKKQITNQFIARANVKRRRFNLELEHVKLELGHIYWQEKITSLKMRDKQRFVKALNKLIKDFKVSKDYDPDWTKGTSISARLMDKWQEDKR